MTTSTHHSRLKAWDCLTNLEQQCIFLTMGQGLTSMKATQIMGISKYKFLELKRRTDTLFKYYIEYFTLYNSLIPKSTDVSKHFQGFVIGCLKERLPLKEAVIHNGLNQWTRKSIRNPEIIKNFKILKNSEDPHERHLAILLQEFDRWNNFRVLPRDLQLQSPYKRKNIRKNKEYIKHLMSLPDSLILRLKKQEPSVKSKHLFIPLVSDCFDNNYKVLRANKNQSFLDIYNKNKLLIFQHKEEAESFAKLIMQYPEIDTSTKGFEFWKNYEAIICKAVNYSEVTNMTIEHAIHDILFNQ